MLTAEAQKKNKKNISFRLDLVGYTSILTYVYTAFI